MSINYILINCCIYLINCSVISNGGRNILQKSDPMRKPATG